MSAPADLYAEVTNRILASLETGVLPWRKSWASSGLALRSTGTAYKGINQLLLSCIAGGAGFASPYWLSFKQALDAGGHVRKGERSTIVILWKDVGKKGDDVPEEERGKRLMLRSYRVFNADQCDGLPERFNPPAMERNADQLDLDIELKLTLCGATIVEGEPAWVPLTDQVRMPPFARFDTAGAYYATLAHELVHWTGGKPRLDRGVNFASPTEYAFEELVAEIGAAMACARLGIEGEHIDNHAAYVGGWMKRLKDEPKALFRAATLAQSAVEYLLPSPQGDE